MRRLLPLMLPLAMLAAPPSGEAATLRGFTTLSGSTVRLSDLFDGCGTAGARVLGLGPAMGGRIVVEAPQLAAIARQFGVDWQPASGGDRAILDRAGVPLPRETVMDALRMALRAGGAAADTEVDMPQYQPPMVPDAGARADVGQLDFDPASGRFSATLAIAMGDDPPLHLRVAGRAVGMADIAVPVRRMMPGDVIGAADVRTTRVRDTATRGEVARRPGDLIGKALRHAVPAGQPVMLTDLEAPSLVLRNMTVAMSLASGTLTVAGRGRALESGALGDVVHVMNPGTGAVMEAEVTGQGTVRIVPGTAQMPRSGFGNPGLGGSFDAAGGSALSGAARLVSLR